MSTAMVENHTENNTDFGSRQLPQAGTQIATTRAAQEVQAAMIVAKKYPRDETAAFSRIMQACKRKGLAENAVYVYPRGNQTVQGPSIRMAEVLAQNWGNIDFGIIELENKYQESQVMSYAWDLETNTRQTKVFSVKHERHTKGGSYALTDPRDIYEMIANQGARRLRACILGIIPGDVVDAAVAECEKTMSGGNGEPLVDRVRKMVAAFAEKGVSLEMIERRIGHPVATCIEAELVTLRKIFTSIKDGIGNVTDFFSQSQTVPEGKTKSEVVKEQLAAQMEQSRADRQDEPPNNGEESQEPEPSLEQQIARKMSDAIGIASENSVLMKIEQEVGAIADEATRTRLYDEITARREALKKLSGGKSKDGKLPGTE